MIDKTKVIEGWTGPGRRDTQIELLQLSEDGLRIDTGGSFQSGHLGYLEGIILYDPSNPQSVIAARELIETGIKDAINNAMGVPIAAFGIEANRKFGPACGNYHIWLKRVKSALDPNTASDPFFYVEAEREIEVNDNKNDI